MLCQYQNITFVPNEKKKFLDTLKPLNLGKESFKQKKSFLKENLIE